MAKKSVKNVNETQKRIIGKPFEKGNNFGKGRPKKEFCIPDVLRKLLSEEITVTNKAGKESKKMALEAICTRAIVQAVNGDKDARAWIANRLEGKARQPIEIDGKLDQNIQIEDKRKELENISYEELLEKINESLFLN